MARYGLALDNRSTSLSEAEEYSGWSWNWRGPRRSLPSTSGIHHPEGEEAESRKRENRARVKGPESKGRRRGTGHAIVKMLPWQSRRTSLLRESRACRSVSRGEIDFRDSSRDFLTGAVE